MSLQAQPKLLDVDREIVVDLFAGGGGASSAFEEATGRVVDVAINHDAAAIAMHQANHPQTHHFQSDIWDVDPRRVVEMFGGRPVGFLWASPDCTTFSKAKGGAPFRDKNKKSRSLGWVLRWWAGTVRPRVIHVENVEEWATWGPTFRNRKGRMKKAKGRRFQVLVQSLRDMGYVVDWRELRACDYGAPTIRKRLYLVARCDGQPIVWPAATHADPKSKTFAKSGLLPWNPAADCIDWSLPMCSIFATKEEAKAWAKEHGQACPIRPLAFNTNKRIARGVKRFVLDSPKPYLRLVYGNGTSVPFTAQLAHGEESSKGKRWGEGVRSAEDPHTTIACSNDTAVVAPMIVPVTHEGDRRTPGADEPLGTITCAHRGEFAVSSGFMVPRYGEREGQEPRSRSVEEPAPTIVPDGNGGQLVAPCIVQSNHGDTPFSSVDAPLRTVMAGGTHHAVVASNLTPYYGAKSEDETRAHSLDEPLATITTENRHAIVTSFLAQNNGGFAEGNSGDGHEVTDPLSTINGKGANASLMGAFLDQANGGFDERVGRSVDEPLSTILTESRGRGVLAAHMTHANTGHTPNSAADEPIHTIVSDGARHSVVASHIQRDFGQSVGSDLEEPIGTITADRGGHAALVSTFADREPSWMAQAAKVAPFLELHYGTGEAKGVDGPLPTVVTKDRFGLVNVYIAGEPWIIWDVRMRMLQPRELYLCQGFRAGYIIDVEITVTRKNGKVVRRWLTKTEQVRMVGNSVSTPPARALILANVPEMVVRRAA